MNCALVPRCHFPIAAVVYPTVLSAVANVVSLVGRPPTGLFEKTPPSPVPHVPERMQRRPVSMAAREGEQMWNPLYHAVKRTPPLARLSRCGEVMVGWPKTPRSPTPMSSANSTNTFGLLPASARVFMAAPCAGRVATVDSAAKTHNVTASIVFV